MTKTKPTFRVLLASSGPRDSSERVSNTFPNDVSQFSMAKTTCWFGMTFEPRNPTIFGWSNCLKLITIINHQSLILDSNNHFIGNVIYLKISASNFNRDPIISPSSFSVIRPRSRLMTHGDLIFPTFTDRSMRYT